MVAVATSWSDGLVVMERGGEENGAFVGENKASVGENKAYVGENKAYVGENKAYVGENKAYVGEITAYIGDQPGIKGWASSLNCQGSKVSSRLHPC